MHDAELVPLKYVSAADDDVETENWMLPVSETLVLLAYPPAPPPPLSDAANVPLPAPMTSILLSELFHVAGVGQSPDSETASAAFRKMTFEYAMAYASLLERSDLTVLRRGSLGLQAEEEAPLLFGCLCVRLKTPNAA